MHAIKLDLKNGSALVDSALVKIDEKGILANSIAKLSAPPTHPNQGRTRYRLLQKISIFEKSADCVIEVGEGGSFSIVFLFDFIEFFESSILESKIIKIFEKSLNLKFVSNHPSTAFIDSFEWGNAIFSYDPKQGDLSLEITFGHNSDSEHIEPLKD